MEGCDSDDESTSGYLLSNQAKGYSYEEQFKQLYDLSPDPDRKTFLNDLFSYMQNRGTPVNRIPIMAKQVLDLYELYRLVVARGGLVEVINKKIWREITRGLNLPSSITSAAFTLRTQYMKYLYPYECEKEHLSSPEELQQAIDGNRREGRRSSYGHYSDMIGSPVGAGGSGGSGGGSCEGLAGPSAAGGPSGFNGSSSGAVGGGNNGGGPSTSSSSHRNVSTPLHHLASSTALSLVNRHLLNGVNASVNGHGNRLSGGAVGGNQSLNDCGSGSSGDEEDHGSSLHSLSLNHPLLALASAQAQVQAQAEALNLEVKPSLGHNGPSSSHRNISSPLSLVNRHLMNGGCSSALNNNGHNRNGPGRNNQNDMSVPMDDCGSGSSAQAQVEAVNLDVKGNNGLSALAGLNGPLSSLQAHLNNLSSANNQNMETNNNNSLLLSMKINNIIYSGILYATRSVKR